jgi:hypothetical protein
LSVRIVEILGFEWEETVGPFVLRERKRVHDTGVDHVGEFGLDRVEMFFDTIDFDLSH